MSAVAERPADHNRAIAVAAKATLMPLGFKRKGQSRVWLADHCYWLLVVEFQPSAWSKGSYLNVAAHWLWHPPASTAPLYHLSYNFSRHGLGRVGTFAALDKVEDYGAVTALAEAAADEAQELRATLPSLEAAADAMLAAERVRPANLPPHWGAYDAAVGAALTERGEMAAAFCRSILERPATPNSVLHPAAEKLLGIARDIDAVRAHIGAMIAARREGLRLAPVEAPFA